MWHEEMKLLFHTCAVSGNLSTDCCLFAKQGQEQSTFCLFVRKISTAFCARYREHVDKLDLSLTTFPQFFPTMGYQAAFT
jgi:hypothetical protein